jgi:hypothetical protein
LEFGFWRCFQIVTLVVVWREHGQVLRAGDYRWNTFRQECVRLLVAVSKNQFEQQANRQALAAEAMHAVPNRVRNYLR